MHGNRCRSIACLALLLTFGNAGSLLAAEEKLKGYAEWRRGDVLIVQGQRVTARPGTVFKDDARSLESIPLGYEVEVRGERNADGVIVAREIKAKPNGEAMFESDVLQATNEIEAVWVGAGRMYEPDEDGNEETIGRLLKSGPYVERVDRLMRRLVPPYVDYDRQVRVHVVETEEWNAAAMGNGAIWVYTGLMDSMTDDELAVVLGHELGHYTHEHSRRGAKSSMWQGLLGLGALVAAQALEDDTARGVATVVAGLGLTVWGSGYSRDLEDEADRVGLRYAYEGGFEVGAGPSLWGKFKQRYGESDAITNFFFGSHSRPSARIRNIEREIELNYPDATVTTAVAFETAPTPASSDADDREAGDETDWLQQVRDQFEAFGSRWSDDLDEVSDPEYVELSAGDSADYDVEVRAGQVYVVTGACDQDCDDLDLYGFDDDDDEFASDIELDDVPLLQFEASYSGTITIRVALESCSADTCVAGFQVFVER